MGILSYGYKAGKTVKNFFKGKSKISPTINSVDIKKNLTGRRTDRDSIIKGVDKHLESSNPKSSKIKKKYTDKTSAIYDKYEKKADGGRIGLKRGGGKFPDHSGDGKITKKDILMAKGVIPKTKSKSKKKII